MKANSICKTSINQGPLIKVFLAEPLTIEKAFDSIFSTLHMVRANESGTEHFQSDNTLAEVLEYAGQLSPYVGNSWLEKVSHACNMLLFHKRYLTWCRERTAEEIGRIITNQLMAENYAAPRIVSEGLLRLIAGRTFHPEIKKPNKSWKDKLTVGFTFYYLRHTGISSPSQTEVRLTLSNEGRCFTKKTISVYFDELGLNRYASDARKVASDAGRRKRKQDKLPRA